MYSTNWFQTFAENYPKDWTEQDLMFLEERIGSEDVKQILDVGCGFGRIAGPLSEKGHKVTAIDAYAPIILKGRALYPKVNFKVMDMQELHKLEEKSFDLTINLWNSFGYYTHEENYQILFKIRNLLKIDGTAIFDLYNPQYLRENLTRQVMRAESECKVVSYMDGNRYTDEFLYKNGARDKISFEVFNPPDFIDMCREAGFADFETLAFWGPVTEIGRSNARYQVVCKVSR
jgi:SAM-dependent methyltransferase